MLGIMSLKTALSKEPPKIAFEAINSCKFMAFMEFSKALYTKGRARVK